MSELLKNNEKVAYYGQNSVLKIYNSFQKSGFTHENALSIISKYPEVLALKSKDLEHRLDMWHMTKFSPTQFYELFVQCPELLDFDDEHLIAKRYMQLQEIVVTPKNIWRLLMASPNVLVDDMRVIKAKVDYILKEMEADVTDLVKSGVLGLPLEKIKTRHTLLVRLGIFKKRNWRASELDPNKNPRLFRIMDCSDEVFASRVCGISMKELEAFNELYERELYEKHEEELDYEENSDSDYDDDDDEDDDYDPRETGDYYDDRNKKRYRRHSKK